MTKKQLETWITDKMNPGQWYNLKPEDVSFFKVLIMDDFGWSNFQLSFNNGMNRIKKTII
jgi:hypothetical protein